MPPETIPCQSFWMHYINILHCHRLLFCYIFPPREIFRCCHEATWYHQGFHQLNQRLGCDSFHRNYNFKWAMQIPIRTFIPPLLEWNKSLTILLRWKKLHYILCRTTFKSIIVLESSWNIQFNCLKRDWGRQFNCHKRDWGSQCNNSKWNKLY